MDLAYKISIKLNSSYLNYRINNSGSYFLELKPTRFQAKLTFGNGSDGELIIEKLDVLESYSTQAGNYDYGPELQKQIDDIFTEKKEDIDGAVEQYLLPLLNGALTDFQDVESLSAEIMKAVADDPNYC